LVIVFRNADVDVPFFSNSDQQPAARWHADGEGPAQYTSSTPDASWAEFLRHNGIVDVDDLAGIERTMWAVEIPDHEPTGSPALPMATLTGDLTSYPDCQAEAARLRPSGISRLMAISAAIVPGTPSGWVSGSDLRPAPARDELTIVLFGPRPDLVGWVSAMLGRPEVTLLDRVRHLQSQSATRRGGRSLST
jgi:hypothetical protein